MHELWSTILAPALDAARPRVVLHVGTSDERLAELTARLIEPWGGSVQSWQPSAGAPPSGDAELVLLHPGDGYPSVEVTLEVLARAAFDAGRPLPIVLVGGVEGRHGEDGVRSATRDDDHEGDGDGNREGEALAAVRRFAATRTHAQLLVVPGLGGLAIIAEPPLIQDGYGRLIKLLEDLRLAPVAYAHLQAVERRRHAEHARAEQAWSRLADAEARAADLQALAAERLELAARVRELASERGALHTRTSELAAERDQLLARVSELSDALTATPVVPAAPAPAGELAPSPSEPTQADMRELLRPLELLAELGRLGPEEDLAMPIPNNVLPEHARCEWEWPATPTEQPPAIAYLLPGLPPEGSGGSHSLVQEARGMRTLGADTRVCVPLDALATAERLYGNDDRLFLAYLSEQDILQAVGHAAVVVSTEYTSVALAARIVELRPNTICAYYVQDYEPLFAPPRSARSDRALLSYRAIPGQTLFAKTHWLRNVVMARHGVPVMKVAPSLDSSLFHAQGRSEEDRLLRVAAMVRPRTPRRRAAATLQALQRIAHTLGRQVEVLAFGCDADAFAELPGTEAADVAHLGLLTRAEVAQLMRRTHVFIDASAYQAFGRTGLEAMACGAVPLLPALGGVYEYAAHDRDALICTHDSPEAIAQAVCALLQDPARLRRLRDAGLHSAARFSIERAARSQLGLFAALTTSRLEPVTVAA
jgi:hypothetical protein